MLLLHCSTARLPRTSRTESTIDRYGGLGLASWLVVLHVTRQISTVRREHRSTSTDSPRRTEISIRYSKTGWPILTHPTCIWDCPVWGVGDDAGRISRRSLASENQSPWTIVWCCLCDPTFSRFSRTPTRDTQTDGHTRGHG